MTRAARSPLSRLIVLALVVLLAGCAAFPGLPGRLAAFASLTASGAGGRHDLRPAGYGLLRLTVRWPSGPGKDLRGYQAQVIPDSTSRIFVSVRKAGTEVATASLDREAGEATKSVSIAVPGQSNLSVSADAFAGDQKVARATAAGVNVVPGGTSYVDLTMLSLFAPTIDSLDYNAGGEGDQVLIAGSNLRADWLQGARARILLEGAGGASVSFDVVEGEDTWAVVQIPQGAATGRVVAVVDGVPSQSAAMLWVLSDLQIEAPRESWEDTEGNYRRRLYGETLTLTALPTWVVPPGREAADFGTPPSPDWRVMAYPSGDPAGSLTDTAGTTNSYLAPGRSAQDTIQTDFGWRHDWYNDLQVISTAIGPFEEAFSMRLPAPREDFGLAVTGRFLHVVGGREASGAVTKVERAAITPEGNLDTWTASPGGNLQVARSEAGQQVLAIGDYLYVFGGRDQNGATLASIERAPIDANGELGAFETPTYDGVALGLLRPRRYGSAVRAGNYVYLLGGLEGDGFSPGAWAERAPILDGQGNLGPFQDVTASSGLAVAVAGHAAVATGRMVIVAGGSTQVSSTTAVQVAGLLDEQGTLGAFGVPRNLTVGRQGLRLVGVGGDLLVLGGAASTGTAYREIESARLDPLGAPEPFSVLGNSELLDGPFLHGAVVIRGWLYVLGGRGSGGGGDLWEACQRARVPFGGTGANLDLEVR